MSGAASYVDPVRNVDMVFMAHLELLEREVRPLPGSFVHRKNVDPRLTGLKVMMTSAGAVGPREGDEVCLYETVAMLRHRPSGDVYLAFRQTIDQLMLEQTDPVRFPKWLMEHPVKRTELKIHIARVKSKPAGKDDRSISLRFSSGIPVEGFSCAPEPLGIECIEQVSVGPEFAQIFRVETLSYRHRNHQRKGRKQFLQIWKAGAVQLDGGCSRLTRN